MTNSESLFPCDPKQTTGIRWTQSYVSILNNGQPFAVSNVITDRKLNMRWKILIIPSLEDTVQKDPNVPAKRLYYKDNDYVSLYLISVDSQHDRTVKCDFTFDLEGADSSIPTAKRMSSFEFTSTQQYCGWQKFMPIKQFLRDYVDQTGEFKVSVSVDVVVEKGVAQPNHMVSIIDKLNKLITTKDRSFISLIQSFYLIPSLRRSYLELPTGKEDNQTIAFELQRIFYHLSKNRVATANRLSQAIKYYTYFHSINPQDLGKIISETLSQAIESSPEEGKTKLTYYFLDENENSVNVIRVDSNPQSKDLIEYLKLYSPQIRELDIFPPILFISLPKTKQKEGAGAPKLNQIRTDEISFPEDFYIDQICQDSDDCDDRSNESHYVLYSVWVHEHSFDNTKGNYYTYTRPLNQPHWIKMQHDGVEEVTFNSLLLTSAGPSDNRLPFKLNSQTELRNDVSYAHDKFQLTTDTSAFQHMFDDEPTDPNDIMDANVPPLVDDDSNEENDDDGNKKRKKKPGTTNNNKSGGKTVVIDEDRSLENLYTNMAHKVNEAFKKDQKTKEKEQKDVKNSSSTPPLSSSKPAASTNNNNNNTNNNKTTTPTTTSPTTSTPRTTTPETNNNNNNNHNNNNNNNQNNHHDNVEIEKKMATLESKIVKLQEKYNQQMEEYKKMVENEAETRNLNQKLKKDTEQLQKTIEKHQKAIDELNKSNETAKKSLEESKKKSENQKKELEIMRKSAEQHNRNMESLKKENATTKKQKEQLQKDLDMVKKKGGVDELKEEMLTLRKTLEDKEALLRKYTCDKDLLGSLNLTELFEINNLVTTSLQKIGDVMSQQTNCVVCMEFHREILFVPCGHHVVCTNCSNYLNTCPICRKLIEQRIKVISN
ncbi:hypothetical protein DFA_00826 [Cavenderia fasciculata]|uniref:RING zinc finger-containing protein n=1 Tax=Cavenderia fasciculata TaxID=261658 RepID=F4PU31_CACFS|nr:uncharacterized protein DFA_00826 [Cavenderia fasciculata]EGG20957.1 hypothetical protein DFA_00826 [Cavenderia fasciculata]|eukprot:XP_004358807.1 hypothetical protein DFA_00826 [Cavenderia fasciculata]